MREKLANLAHEQWSGWMEYLFSRSVRSDNGSVIIPSDLVKRWERQLNTPYKNLSEEEKESDRIEADKYIELLRGNNV